MLVTIAALAFARIASSSQLGRSPGATPFVIVIQPVKKSEMVLVAADVSASNAKTALDAIRRLKPQFLRRRVIPTAWDPYDGFPAVYVDGVLLGELRTLETIKADQIVEIRYIPPRSLAMSDGFHFGGVIAVRTKKPRL